jgi:hypothetical protein
MRLFRVRHRSRQQKVHENRSAEVAQVRRLEPAVENNGSSQHCHLCRPRAQQFSRCNREQNYQRKKYKQEKKRIERH